MKERKRRETVNDGSGGRISRPTFLDSLGHLSARLSSGRTAASDKNLPQVVSRRMPVGSGGSAAVEEGRGSLIRPFTPPKTRHPVRQLNASSDSDSDSSSESDSSVEDPCNKVAPLLVPFDQQTAPASLSFSELKPSDMLRQNPNPHGIVNGTNNYQTRSKSKLDSDMELQDPD